MKTFSLNYFSVSNLFDIVDILRNTEDLLYKKHNSIICMIFCRWKSTWGQIIASV